MELHVPNNIEIGIYCHKMVHRPNALVLGLLIGPYEIAIIQWSKATYYGITVEIALGADACSADQGVQQSTIVSIFQEDRKNVLR